MLFPGDLKACHMLSPGFQLTYLKDKEKILEETREDRGQENSDG